MLPAGNLAPEVNREQSASSKSKAKPTQEKTKSEVPRQNAKKDSSGAANSTQAVSRIKYVAQRELEAELAKLEQLSGAVLAGDMTAIDTLRAALDEVPHIWQRLADLQISIEVKLVELVAGEAPCASRSFRKRCSEFRSEILEGRPASLATKMAGSRAVACWMFVQLLELRALESPAALRNVKALEQAERRFNVAMRTFQFARLSDAQLQRLAETA